MTIRPTDAPTATAGTAVAEELLFSCSFVVVVIIAVIPWGYVWRR